MSRHDEDYDELFGELAALSYRVAFRLTGDRDASEDLAQEAMTRAYLRWSRMNGHAEAWVVRVTTNLVIGRWRRLSRRLPPALEPSPGADHGMADRLALTTALRSLPRRQREVAVLRHLGDLSIEQTAETMGCSVGTVKQHSARALTALRLALDSPPGVGSTRPARRPGTALRAPTVAAPPFPDVERNPDVR